jgi:hypothetical protein
VQTWKGLCGKWDNPCSPAASLQLGCEHTLSDVARLKNVGEPVPMLSALLCWGVLWCAAGTVEDALLRWLRAAELTCDRAALLVAQDPAVVIGALMKLAGGSPAFAHELSVDAFLQQVCGFGVACLLAFFRLHLVRALSFTLVAGWGGPP